MKNTGIIYWDHNKIYSIKRDILFFDNLTYYDSSLNEYEFWLKCAYQKTGLVDYVYAIEELESNIEYLRNKDVLSSINKATLMESFINSNENQKRRIERYIEMLNYVESSKSLKDFENDFFRFSENNTTTINNFVKNRLIRYDYTARVVGSILNNSNSSESHFTPIVYDFGLEKFKEVYFETKRAEIVKLVISNIPVPHSQVPYDELLDFREEKNNKLRYMALNNWIRNVTDSAISVNEVADELEYLTLDFANYMNLQKSNHGLCNIEIFLTLPLEIIEKLIKVQWSKLPESIFKIQRSKRQLLLEEYNAPGREIAYIVKTKDKYGKSKKVIKNK